MMRQPSTSTTKRRTAPPSLLLLTRIVLLVVLVCTHGKGGVHSLIDDVEKNFCPTDSGGNAMMQNSGGSSSNGCSAGDNTSHDGTASPFSPLTDTNQPQQHDTVPKEEHKELIQEMKKRDEDLHKLVYDIGQGQETTWVYRTKDNPESSMMRRITLPSSTVEEEEDSQSQTLSTLVRLCKFYNLSNRTMHLILKHSDTQFELVKKYKPMMASGVACQIGQEFLFLDLTSPQKPVAEFAVVPKINDEQDQGAFLFVHDEFVQQNHDSSNLAEFLSVPLYEQYVLFQKTLAFDKVYRNATGGRVYLSNIGRAQPVYPLWKANHIGQTHRVATIDANQKETYLSLNVVSTSPRIFKIPNFLSLSEVQHIMTMARKKGMKPSETSGQAQAQEQRRASSSSYAITRTSQTAWLSHSHSPILHVIYQRAADVLQIPHDIFRNVVAEDLQVLYYNKNAEYKAHYDFGFPPINHPQQPTRFATLLIYLNDEDMEGGETAFPRAVLVPDPKPDEYSNHQAIQNMTNNSGDKAMLFKQKPETGTAILFYSMLPDGNMDERSLHAALPVIRGEKYLCNLWVWDPVADLVGLQ